jgi:hypothetical protein
MQREATLNELRVAIHQTHGCDAGAVCEIVDVAPGPGATPVSVHVFHVAGHRHADRCYAWPEYPDPTTMIVHAVLHAGPVRCAEDAVRARAGTSTRRGAVGAPSARAPTR